jgi:hypothetical protein
VIQASKTRALILIAMTVSYQLAWSFTIVNEKRNGKAPVEFQGFFKDFNECVRSQRHFNDCDWYLDAKLPDNVKARLKLVVGDDLEAGPLYKCEKQIKKLKDLRSEEDWQRGFCMDIRLFSGSRPGYVAFRDLGKAARGFHYRISLITY